MLPHPFFDVGTLSDVSAPERLVRIICRGRCGGGEHLARLAKEEGPHENLGTPDQPFHGYVAYCVDCGYRAMDHYNWR